ncbi:MAG: D-glycerate dehydrogenase [Candidatus Rokubacteria bacterium]|nr:D-glycerate dehydrogenase [Candidatus Rokubacteria bacterium]
MSGARPKVFITQPVAEAAIRRLRAVAEVTWNPDPLHVMTKSELCEAIRENEYLFCLLHDTIDAEVIAANHALKVIASMAITPSGIDVKAATARRIPVTVIPPIVTEATADLHWALLLAVARRVVEADRFLRTGTFPGGQSSSLEGAAVYGKTIGIIGCGRVGQAVARRARGFGMGILYYERTPLAPAEEEDLGVRYTAMARLLADADFVSVNCAYTRETHHQIGEPELARMKRTAYLVNTARGPVVDEKALVKALQEKRIAGAALDVFEEEPHVGPELVGLGNVVLTPHIGSAVTELREEMALIVAENILAVIEGRRPPNCFNPEIYG